MQSQLEQLQILERFHVEVTKKSQEEIANLHKINEDLEAKIATHVETITQLKSTLKTKERHMQDIQAQLVAAKEELSGAMESLQALVRIDNQEDAMGMNRARLNAVKSLEHVKKQFNVWNLRYLDVVPGSELANK